MFRAFAHTHTQSLAITRLVKLHTKKHLPPKHTHNPPHTHKPVLRTQFQQAFNRLRGRGDTNGQRRSQSQTTGTNNTITMLSVQQVHRHAPISADAASTGATSASDTDIALTADHPQPTNGCIVAPAVASADATDTAKAAAASMRKHRKPSRRSVRQLNRLMRSDGIRSAQTLGGGSDGGAGDAGASNATGAVSVRCKSAVTRVAFEMTVFVAGDGSDDGAPDMPNVVQSNMC